jgi:rod shape-determining protein MreD
MRWLTFFVLAVTMLVLASAVAPRLSVFGIWPDWLLVTALFFALYGRPVDAVLGGWLLGALADLMTVERLGFLALSYALAALLVASVREYLFRYRPAVQSALVFVVSLVVRLVWSVYRGVLYDSGQSAAAMVLSDWLLGSLYTAAWAPLFFKILLSMSRSLGIPQPRYTFAGLHRLGGARV